MTLKVDDHSERPFGRIPFAVLRDQSPPDLRALYAELQDGQALIPA